MKREIILIITVDWEDYDGVCDEIILEDTGIYNDLKDGVTIKIKEEPMKPGEEWTDPKTGKVYVAEEGKAIGDCTNCVNDTTRRKRYCKSFPICYPNTETEWYDIIFKEKEEKP